MKKTLIIGAGDAAKMVAKEILASSKISGSFNLIGFLDDDENKKTLLDLPVLGKLCDAQKIINEQNVESVIIAIPSAPRDLISSLLLKLAPLKKELKIVPGLYEIIEGDVTWKQIRPVSAEDLLGREEVGFDFELLNPFYKNKTVFITGAGGSIGSELVKQLLKLPVKKLYAFGRGENSIHTLSLACSKDPRFHYLIGNIKDYEKILFELKESAPDIVFHAAAHKHVPIMEEFPEEAVKNNIIGSYNVAKASLESNVKQFVLISTDKAVNPTSIMGASKKIAEKIILSLNQSDKTKFLCTRFGNVLGSRGSVIPTFLKQIKKGGPLTITHPEIERYFMSIPEAARLVIKAPSVEEGKIFVLNMGKPVKILELAKNLVKLSGFIEDEIPFVFTGLRKGEKLYEELFSTQENLKSTPFEKLKISLGEEKLFSFSKIDEILNQFKALSSQIKREEIKDFIKNLLPNYQRK